MKNYNSCMVSKGGTEILADIVEQNQKRIAIEKTQQKITLRNKALSAHIVKLKEKIIDIKSAHSRHIERYTNSASELAAEIFGFENNQHNQLDISLRKILDSKLLRLCKIRKNLFSLAFLCFEFVLCSVILYIDRHYIMEINSIIQLLMISLLYHVFPPIFISLFYLEQKINLGGATRCYIRGLKHFENRCGCSKKIALKEAELNCLNQKIRD